MPLLRDGKRRYFGTGPAPAGEVRTTIRRYEKDSSVYGVAGLIIDLGTPAVYDFIRWTMDPNEIYNLLQKRPLEPFALRLLDGRVFEVRHPEMALVTKRAVVLGVHRNGAQGPADETVVLSLVAIASLHPLNV